MFQLEIVLTEDFQVTQKEPPVLWGLANTETVPERAPVRPTGAPCELRVFRCKAGVTECIVGDQ